MKGNSTRPWILIACLCVLAVAVLGGAYLVVKWPFTPKGVRQVLQQRPARTVEFTGFRQTFFPPGCVIDGVKFLRHNHPDRQPVITVKQLVIQGSYFGMLTYTKHIPDIHIVGLRIMIPPRGPDGQSHGVIPLTQSKAGRPMVIGDVSTDDAVIEFMPRQAGKQPFSLDIQHLELQHIGSADPIGYRATLRNTEPPGEIHSTGTFGPWNPDDPGRTPVSGSYTFDGAKLGVFKGISGSLSAKGTFQGALDTIKADSAIDVSNFHAAHGGETVHLSTTLHAVVNATDGDTLLRDVTSRFDRTAIVAQGDIAGTPGRQGKTVVLDLAVNGGHIEDLLRLLVSAKRPAMAGEISLHAKAELPPDGRPFLEKLSLRGDFGVSGAHFTNASHQQPINQLSESARGENKKEQAQDLRTVLSNLKGNVVLRNGTATLSNVSFSVPGALAHLDGTFNLISEQVDLHGVLQTEGKLSDATTGFKSLFLKVVSPLFKKRQGVEFVPFKITGTYAQPAVALDWGQKKHL